MTQRTSLGNLVEPDERPRGGGPHKLEQGSSGWLWFTWIIVVAIAITTAWLLYKLGHRDQQYSPPAQEEQSQGQESSVAAPYEPSAQERALAAVGATSIDNLRGRLVAMHNALEVVPDPIMENRLADISLLWSRNSNDGDLPIHQWICYALESYQEAIGDLESAVSDHNRKIAAYNTARAYLSADESLPVLPVYAVVVPEIPMDIECNL